MSLVGHVITGYKGTPHVSASDAGLFNAGIVGLKRYVLGTGEVFRAAAFSNRILIYPGDLVDQGRHINLPAMAEMYIPSAPVGYQRRYIIAMKYNRNETGVESAGLYLIMGVAAQSNPALPTGIRGDIFAGAAEDDTYLYDVLVDETCVVSCEPNAEDFIVIKPLSDMQTVEQGNITLPSGWTSGGSGRNFYYRVGKICMVGMDCTPSARMNMATIFTLPESCRPIKTLRYSPIPGVGRANEDGGDHYVIINTNGTFVYTGNGRLWQTFTFICNGE